MEDFSGFDIEKNFWDVNPEAKYMDVIIDFYEKDKSINKSESSKVMWLITLVYNSSSTFFSMPLNKRKEVIARNYMKNEKFNWKEIEPLISSYVQNLQTSAQRGLAAWNNKMEERIQYMNDTHYDRTTAEFLDKMLSNNKKLYEDYDSIVKRLKQDGDSKSKGNAKKSASDAGMI